MTFPDLAHLIEPDQDRIFGCLRQNLFYHLMPHLALLGKVNDFTGIAYWVNGFNDFFRSADSFPENSSSIIAPRIARTKGG